MPKAVIKVKKLYILYIKLKEELKFIRERICKYYNVKRLEEPRLKRKDKVFFLIRNLYTKRLSKKLNYKKVRLFTVKKKILEIIFKLELLKII